MLLLTIQLSIQTYLAKARVQVLRVNALRTFRFCMLIKELKG